MKYLGCSYRALDEALARGWAIQSGQVNSFRRRRGQRARAKRINDGRRFLALARELPDVASLKIWTLRPDLSWNPT